MIAHGSPFTRQVLDYEAVRALSLQLCRPLAEEDYVVQPATDVSPPKWHLGHTTWFFENFILAEHLPNYQRFDARLNWFFNSYYESQGPRIQRAQRGNMSRPTLPTILAYRETVDRQLLALLAERPDDPDLLALVQIGLQHEQQHQELLLTDIKYILGNNPLYPVYAAPARPIAETGDSRPAGWLELEEGLYEVGYEGQGFSWDNERSRHKVFLPASALQDRLITNGEFLEFIRDGGYRRHELWLSEGWEWIRQGEVQAPLYWHETDGRWSYYTLGGLQELTPAAPVTHVSYYEAEAFARWRGLRLPTEFEWEAVCRQYGPEAPPATGFLEGAAFHPGIAVEASDFQLLGHAWGWTGSAYLPYPDYPRFKGALGEYNGKFMINQMVLRGGSCATPVTHIRPTYRNFFHADKRWQFTGIRLAR